MRKLTLEEAKAIADTIQGVNEELGPKAKRFVGGAMAALAVATGMQATTPDGCRSADGHTSCEKVLAKKMTGDFDPEVMKRHAESLSKLGLDPRKHSVFAQYYQKQDEKTIVNDNMVPDSVKPAKKPQKIVQK